MADPVTIAMAASTAIKTVGGVVSGLSTASAADRQAGVDRQNAVLASDQAGQREEQIRRQGRQTLGEQAADVAQSGIGFTQSTRDTMDQSAANLSLDALNTRYQGTVQTTNLMNQAKADAAKAHAARISTWIGAGSDALGAIGKYMSPGTGPNVTFPPSPQLLQLTPPPDLDAANLSTTLPGLDGLNLIAGG